MAKYVCSICGFVYDESAGHPESGLAPGTLWNQVPGEWLCPICKASKGAFKLHDSVSSSNETVDLASLDGEDLRELSPAELSALFSNLAKGCEKQYRPEEASLFTRLAEYYKSKSAPFEESTFPELERILEADLDAGFTEANRIAGAAKDRGALRALTWGEKVSRMLLSHMDAYGENGDALLKDTRIFVCEICGFVYIGDEAPEICPVCKVPRLKIHPVERKESYASS